MPILKNIRQLDLSNNGINANVLKIVAVAAMFFDHATNVFVPDGTPMRWGIHLFGRLAAPLICYLIAEGHHYTSNKKAYTIRLFLFALISHFPYVIYFDLSLWKATSVMWSLMLGLIALTAAKHQTMNVFQKSLVILLCCLAAYPANWHYLAVLWIVGFGVFREQFTKKMLFYVAVGGLLYVLPGLLQYGPFVAYRFGFLLAIPFFYYYNRQPGKRSWFSKWAFYWFYPLHLTFFILLSWLIM